MNMNIRHILITILAVLHYSIANAQFNPPDPAEPGYKYRLTLVCSPEEAGKVYGSGSYAKGARVDISASAATGYSFSCWKAGDDVISTSARIEYIMPNTATTLTAYFEKEGPGNFNPTDPSEPNSPGSADNLYHTLTIIKEPENGGTLSREGEVKLKEGETMYIYADPKQGYEVDGWYVDGILQSIQTSYPYTMRGKDETLTVKFIYRPVEPADPGSSGNKEFIVIDTQAKLEEYASIEEFPRSVRITGTDITSLQSLGRMKKINGDLRIENTSLATLEGLDNLSEIIGKLIIRDNRLLTTMDGIGSWDGIRYALIESNPILTDFCSMTEYAQKGETAYGDIRGNAYNPSFEDIRDGLCSKSNGIDDVTCDREQLDIIVTPSSPTANENCMIHILGNHKYDELRIYDVKGRLHTIIKNPVESNPYRFDEAGMYIIKLLSANNTSPKDTFKIVVR